jgi:hypothetical protein
LSWLTFSTSAARTQLFPDGVLNNCAMYNSISMTEVNYFA